MNLGENTMRLLDRRTYAFQWDSDIYKCIRDYNNGIELTVNVNIVLTVSLSPSTKQTFIIYNSGGR